MADNQKKTQEPDLNQLRKVRREKLAELQQNGSFSRDPKSTRLNSSHVSESLMPSSA